MRFELTTLTLARLCSTPELRPRPWVRGMYKLRNKVASEKCAFRVEFAYGVFWWLSRSAWRPQWTYQ